MTWTNPMTFVAGTTLTAAQLNANLRDNMLETAPGKATTAGRLFVATGANAIAERPVSDAFIATIQTTTSTTYTDLTTVGPTQTVTTGTSAFVIIRSGLSNSASGNDCFVSVDVSGASTVAASDAWAIQFRSTSATNGLGAAVTHLFTGLTAGSNTFTCKFRVSAGTGSFQNRTLTVIGL